MLAMASIVDALQHMVEHDDEHALLAMEELALVAWRYSTSHPCYDARGVNPTPNALLVPRRAQLVQELVRLVRDGRRKRLGSQLVADLLYLRLRLSAMYAGLGEPKSGNLIERMRSNVAKAFDKAADDANVVVWALDAYGFAHAKAHDIVENATKSGLELKSRKV